jgi:hypothetical protein
VAGRVQMWLFWEGCFAGIVSVVALGKLGGGAGEGKAGEREEG